MSKISESLVKQKMCLFAKVFSSLDPEDQGAIDTALENGTTSNAISNAIRNGGFTMYHQTVTDHRNEVCACFREKK